MIEEVWELAICGSRLHYYFKLAILKVIIIIPEHLKHLCNMHTLK